MKTLIASTLIALASLTATAVQAGADNAGHGAMQQATASAPTQMVDGQVKKVDKSAGKVTLSHGPLENLNMPAMTMVFRVKEAVWLDQMKAGDKIRFMADNVNGAVTIVHFEANK
jgi:Cu/Ag efflux protein CusF